jgi:hypothetical protein
MINRKTNLCENLLRRSFDNHILTYRHNKREDEILDQKFSLYQRQIRVLGHNIHMAERRCEQHAKNDLGFTISYKRKPLEPSADHPFYYRSTNKNWTTKEYLVQSSVDVLQNRNLYEYAFERRSRQYVEELKQKNHLQKLRKEHFMDETEVLIRDDYQRNNDWPLSDNARLKLPLIQCTKSKRLPKIHFPIEI